MKILYFAVLLLALVACGEEKSSETSETGQTKASVPTQDTVLCVQLNSRTFNEMLELSISEDGIVRGEGGHIPIGLGKSYAIQVQGSAEGQDLELRLDYYEQNQSSPSYSTEETWSWQGKKWRIDNRAAAEFLPENINYWPILCPTDTSDKEGYHSIYGFNEGYAVVERNKSFGLINEEGELVIPLVYANLSDVVEGTLTYQNEQGQGYGLLRPDGKELTSAKYSQLLPQNEGRIAYFDASLKAWGFMDSSLKVVIKPRFSQINSYAEDYTQLPFNEGLANVAMAGRWGFIDRQGKEVIPFDYSFADAFKDGKARVAQSGKFFYIDKSGNCVENCD